ncbi:hypothetical protein DM02DRAFT_664124 [Periconia macrospinosa]|uniref:Uncharacterized protein n=1 Tax=Periconia macrospinosa TaxID=97972 RepID=A0A2V1D217_9PLEO|nr:hypothetical protein DM02DRAFT_664124 [Periconia macrospinosa]
MGTLGGRFLQCLGILSVPPDVSNSQSYRKFGEVRDPLGGIDAAELKPTLETFIQGLYQSRKSLKKRHIKRQDLVLYATLQHGKSPNSRCHIYRNLKPSGRLRVSNVNREVY